jgi:hypothetical protein
MQSYAGVPLFKIEVQDRYDALKRTAGTASGVQRSFSGQNTSEETLQAVSHSLKLHHDASREPGRRQFSTVRPFLTCVTARETACFELRSEKMSLPRDLREDPFSTGSLGVRDVLDTYLSMRCGCL